MQLRFHGAIGGQVTGSMHELVDEKRGVHILVDCGMVQGEANADAQNQAPFPFEPSRITHVLLTHAHLDHCGRLPLLYRRGFSGIVTCSEETERLARINLESAARQSGLFSVEEVERIRFRRWPGTFFGKPHPLANDVMVTPTISSHILGACSYAVAFKDGDVWEPVTFSGDVGANIEGQAPLPLLRPGQSPFVSPDSTKAVVVVESTYGGQTALPVSAHDRRAFLRAEVERLAKHGGTLVIPSFAIQRTQDVLFDLHVVLNASGLVDALPILLDAPLASEVNSVYAESLSRTEIVKRKHFATKVRHVWRNAEELERLGLDPNEDFPVFVDMVRVALGHDALNAHRLKGHSSDLVCRWRSALYNGVSGSPPRIIVAGSGMCQGGRIVGHLRRLLVRSDTTVMFTGYASPCTPAGRLIEMADLPLDERRHLVGGVGFEQDDVAMASVTARLIRAVGYSGHASQPVLLDWLFPAVKGRSERHCAGRRVFVVHGSVHGQQALARAIADQARTLGVPVPEVTVVSAEDGWFDLEARPQTAPEVLSALEDAARAAAQSNNPALAARLRALLESGIAVNG